MDWATFQVMRRTHSNLMSFKVDPKVILRIRKLKKFVD